MGSGTSYSKSILRIKGGIIMKKVDKQWAREFLAVCLFVVTMCIVCVVINGTGYVPVSMVC